MFQQLDRQFLIGIDRSGRYYDVCCAVMEMRVWTQTIEVDLDKPALYLQQELLSRCPFCKAHILFTADIARVEKAMQSNPLKYGDPPGVHEGLHSLTLCPYCGSVPRFINYWSSVPPHGSWGVQCDCDRGRQRQNQSQQPLTKTQAVEEWSTWTRQVRSSETSHSRQQ